jgi:hypothetical protein
MSTANPSIIHHVNNVTAALVDTPDHTRPAVLPRAAVELRLCAAQLALLAAGLPAARFRPPAAREQQPRQQRWWQHQRSNAPTQGVCRGVSSAARSSTRAASTSVVACSGARRCKAAGGRRHRCHFAPGTHSDRERSLCWHAPPRCMTNRHLSHCRADGLTGFVRDAAEGAGAAVAVRLAGKLERS